MNDAEREFLIQSNLIENVGDEGLADSIAAWEYIKKKDAITKHTILHAHKLVMRNLWPEIAGKLRTWNVTVGGRSCPDWRTLEETLPLILYDLNCDRINFEKDISSNREEVRKVSFTKAAHVGFEKWHGFADGNGRVGRILYNWQRLRLGLPIHIIKYSERWEYYKLFE